MYGLIGYDNIWIQIQLKIWNLKVQENLNIEKITFKLSNEVLSHAYYLIKN